MRLIAETLSGFSFIPATVTRSPMKVRSCMSNSHLAFFSLRFTCGAGTAIASLCGNHYVAGFESRLVLLSKALYHTCFICGQRCKWWSRRPKLTSSVISDVKPITYILHFYLVCSVQGCFQTLVVVFFCYSIDRVVIRNHLDTINVLEELVDDLEVHLRRRRDAKGKSKVPAPSKWRVEGGQIDDLFSQL